MKKFFCLKNIQNNMKIKILLCDFSHIFIFVTLNILNLNFCISNLKQNNREYSIKGLIV